MRPLLLLLAWFLFPLGACVPEQEVVLTAKDMLEVDTLYVNTFDSLKLELDSICEIQTDSLVKAFSDSLLPIRLKQVLRQRARAAQATQ